MVVASKKKGRKKAPKETAETQKEKPDGKELIRVPDDDDDPSEISDIELDKKKNAVTAKKLLKGYEKSLSDTKNSEENHYHELFKMRDEIKEWRQIIELQNNLKGMNTINDGGIKKMMETAGTISGIQELAGLVMSALEFSVLSGGEIPIFNNKKIDELIALFLKHCFLSTAKRETDWNIDIAVMEEIVEKSGEIRCSPADVTPSLYKELEYSINFVQYRKSVRNYEPKDGLRAILICLYILSTNIEDKRSDPETLESVLKYLKSEDKWKLAMQYVGVISFGVHEAHAIIDISEISKILKTSSVFPAAYMKGMINRKSKEPTFSLGAKYLVAQVVVSFSSLVLIPFRENLEQHTKCIGSEEKSKEYQELKDLLSDICVHSADRNRYLDEFKWIILTKMTLLSNQRKLDLISRSPSEEMKSHVDVLIARITDLESNWKKMIEEMKKVKKDNSDMRRILETKPAAEDDSKKRKHSMQKDMQGGSLSGSPATKRKKNISESPKLPISTTSKNGNKIDVANQAAHINLLKKKMEAKHQKELENLRKEKQQELKAAMEVNNGLTETVEKLNKRVHGLLKDRVTKEVEPTPEKDLDDDSEDIADRSFESPFVTKKKGDEKKDEEEYDEDDDDDDDDDDNDDDNDDDGYYDDDQE